MAEARFNRGDNVRILSSGKIGTINEVLIRSDNIGYRVTVDGKTGAYQEKYLESYIDEEQEILENLVFGDFGDFQDYHLFQTWFRLKRPLEGSFYSYLASRTIFNPYQFKPLNKFLNSGSEQRLFIADEVGVGKTIETGIILTELIARGRLDRRTPILVICPNALGPKWVKELTQRFQLSFHLFNGPSLKNALHTVISSGYLPEEATWAIVGLELLRHKNYLSILRQLYSSREIPLWSLVIIDEAHHLRNASTDSNELGSILSSLTDMMLMLSATPLNLQDQDLFNQMNILNPSAFPDKETFNAMLSPVKSINRCRRLLAENLTTLYGDILRDLAELEAGPLGEAIAAHPGVIALKRRLQAGGQMSNTELAHFERLLISLSPLDNNFTRTLKREAISHRVTRVPVKVPVQLSPAELDFHNAVIQVTMDAFLARGGNPVALGFVTNMPRRMVSSCIPAMREYLEWCLANDQILGNITDSEEEADDDSECKAIPLPFELRGQMVLLRDQAEKLSDCDTKYAEFKKLLERIREDRDNPQVIVFSFFVRTLKYLQKRLTKDGYKVGLIYGAVPVLSNDKEPSRYDIMDEFQNKEIDILLSSEVGGEGLDFQFCQAMVNYDLPYNPMRIEQRIGRIDRFGQTSDTVTVASMYIQGTVDEDIYTTLYDRIKIVEESVGDLEPILGTQLADLQRDIVGGQLSKEQLAVRMKEIELAVQQAKLEMQKFEENRRELMGDEYFTTPLHSLSEHNDFVLPVDAAKLTDIFLNDRVRCEYREFAAERGQITLSAEVQAKLEQFTRRPGSEGCGEELRPILKIKGPISVIFNGSLADQFRDHQFLPPCGFWIKFVLTELEAEGKLRKSFKLEAQANETGLLPGVYLVPFFEVRIEGLQVELNLTAVPINLREEQVVECDFSQLSRDLTRLSAREQGNSKEQQVPPENPEYLIDKARDFLEHALEEKLSSLRAENKYRIEARTNSLKRGAEARIQRLQQRIHEHQERVKCGEREYSPEFVRMTEASIALEKRRCESSIRNLQAQSELVLTLSLVGVALLEVC